MTVLEIMAVLGIDTTEFQTKLADAVGDVEDLSQKAEDLTNPKLDANGQTVLKPIAEDAKLVDQQLDDLQTKTEETSAIMEGFADATAEVVQQLIEGIIEFGRQSIEAAASTGSELANAYLESAEDLELGLNVLKVKTGEKLLPVTTWWNNLLESLSGADRFDKLHYLAAELEKIADINLLETQTQVEGLFGLFDELDDVKPGNTEDYTRRMEQQAQYWQAYADTLESLKEKGIDPEFLSKIADGSEESMGQLAALDAAGTEDLQGLMAAYASLQTAQENAAQSLSETTLSGVEAAQAIAEAMAPLLAYDMTGAQESPSFIQYLLGDLEEAYPAVESMVNAINEKLLELGYENPLALPDLQGEESADEGGLQVVVNAALSEDSEGNLQGAVDEMNLEGDALIFADPASGAKIQGYLNSLNLTAEVKLTVDDSALSGYKSGGDGRAVGLDYVPYDDYAARLHEGEAVLTKLEAERWRAGEGRGHGSGGDTINVPVTVYGKADPFDIADAVKEVLENYRWMG